ncbi:MAG TPA: alpha/beta hydrolase [Hyphomicrobiaceae bacterium]|jgi:pimeloyl-ACP methyl ester carboxylesterase|nr:alpha/beta hydrolase [Hyphomicrobiaceae bacterium]
MQRWTDIHFTSRDGLRLYARHYPVPGAWRRPLVCLAGLTRNSRDFHDLASALATSDEQGRNVYALDYRGRGRSQHDPNWRNYSILIELNDVLDFLIVKGLHHAAVIGTSRGGILAMLMAVLRPSSVGAVVLNDIGPVIERDGLTRIAAYVGRVPLPADWAEATRIIRDLNHRQFPAVPDAQWGELARQYFNDDNGLPSAAYDPALAKSLAQMTEAIPELWSQFTALTPVPVLALRGELSDILSAATLKDMRQRHARLETATISGQGHAPLLKDDASIRIVADFLQRTDADSRRHPAVAA